MSDKLKKLPSVIEDGEVFEITDFTTVSAWEVFIVQLEEVIREWNLIERTIFKPIRSDDYPLEFNEEVKKIFFDDHPFEVRHYFLRRAEDEEESVNSTTESATGLDSHISEEASLPTGVFRQLLSSDLLFPICDVHPLVKWYGLQEFVIITPALAQPIKGPFRTRFLMSSIALAISATNCEVPIFVQLDDPRRQLYQGICDVGKCGSLRTEFKMAHLKQLPQTYCSVSGLMNMFREKIKVPVVHPLEVNIAAKHTYRIDSWPSEYDYSNVITPGEDGATHLHLPCGLYSIDPIASLYLSITWPNLPKSIEGDLTGSSFVLTDSLHWSLRALYTSRPKCQLNTCMKHYLGLCKRKESCQELLHSKKDPSQMDPAKAIEKLTQAPAHRYGLHRLGKMALESAVSQFQLQRSSQLSGFLPDDVLSRYLTFLFPDSLEQLIGVIPSTSSDDQVADKESDQTYEGLIKQLKAAPFSSLVHRLALCLLMLYAVRDESGTNSAASNAATSENPEGDSSDGKRSSMETSFSSAELKSISNRGSSANLTTSSSFSSLSVKPVTPGKRVTPLTGDQLQRLQYVAHLWQEFVLELRYRWDNGLALWKEIPKSSSSNQEPMEVDQGSQMGSSKSPVTKATEPDLSLCILWQKLQMLQCCIERRISRTKSSQLLQSPKKCVVTSAETTHSDWGDWGHEDHNDNNNDDESDDDKFMDAVTDMSSSHVSFSLCDDVIDDCNTEKGSTTTMKAEGRLQPCGNLRLLHNPNQRLYVPLCQEAGGPFTEDMMWSHTAQLQELGTSAEAAIERAKMQSASLLADMQAFKAANPGCCLEDFVRWYSPRDFEESSDGEPGKLSQRMMLAGNLWKETWDMASPIPANKQKRLFDETKEGEQVLKYLEELTPAQAALHLLPSVVLEVCRTLHSMEDAALEEWKNWVNTFAETASHTTKEHLTHLSPQPENLDQMMRRLMDLEFTMVACKSLRHKFELAAEKDPINRESSQSYLNPLIQELLLGGKQAEVVLEKGAFGPAVRDLQWLLYDVRQRHSNDNKIAYNTTPGSRLDQSASFNLAKPSLNDLLPFPFSREYVVRCLSPRPTPGCSRASPQRLYAMYSPDEYRIAGAFSEDTMLA